MAGPGRGKRKHLKIIGLRHLTTQAALVDGTATVGEVRAALRRESQQHQGLKAECRGVKLGEVSRKLPKGWGIDAGEGVRHERHDSMV